MDKGITRTKIKSLVQKFEANKYHYLSRNYLEEEVKIDFINPLFEALGWDVRNTKGLSPYDREVVVEKGETVGRPDYNFRIDGQTKFFVEVKAPHEPLHKINHVLQAKSYAWNTKNVFIVLLIDFEEFRLFDATIRPDQKNPDQGLIFELTYNEYVDNYEKLLLLSREEVGKDSLDKLILKDSQSKKLRIPVDKAFLEDLSRWREELAKDIYKRNIKELEDRTDEKKVKIQVKILNEAVQKILDRLIFIRIAEDRKIIEPKSLLDLVDWWKAGGKRRCLHRRLTDCFLGWNQDFNGEILKPGPCDVLEIDSHLLAKIIEGLYFPKCPYLFDVIGVELLGSIYERYLGKTIRVTLKRVKIEEKPEVRKAGGVYYTPQYIVDYIVKNTVGKIIKGKPPKQIEKIRILDPACGSGSFLLTAFQTLIDYHLNYYENHPEESGQGTLFPDVIVDYEGKRRLSVEKKAKILRNNIFGVDIDPQAVEIAMMSLYLKCLEGEKDLPRKKELLPSLARNIRCGNSLISYDIFDQLTLFDEEEKERINPFDWYSKSIGFGQIMEDGGFDIVLGNPPYVRQEMLGELKYYFQSHYEVYHGTADLYVYFIEKGIKLTKKGGKFGFIVSNKWMRANYGKNLRRFVKRFQVEQLVDFGELKVFQTASTFPLIIILTNKKKTIQTIYSPIKTLEFKNLDSEVNRSSCKLENAAMSNDGFSLIPLNSLRIVEKIKNKGIPLRGYINNKPFFGIKTGYNKAFIISSEIKDKLIDEDPISREIIKQIIVGDEIRKYHIKDKNKFIILTKIGTSIKNYPAVFEHLKKFQKELEKRYDKGNYWWELRACAYYNEFEKPKIVWPDIAMESRFAYDTTGIYVEATGFILPSDDLYLLGVLNSKISWEWFKRTCYVLGDPDKKGRVRLKSQWIMKFPVHPIDFSNPDEKFRYNEIVKLVEKMLELNKKKISLPPSSKRDKIDRELQITDEKIDVLVYELYGITEQERKIIEEEV